MEKDGTLNIAIVVLERWLGYFNQLIAAANLYKDKDNKIDRVYFYGGGDDEASYAKGIALLYGIPDEYIIVNKPNLKGYIYSCREGVNRIYIMTSWYEWLHDWVKFQKELTPQYWIITELCPGSYDLETLDDFHA